MSRRIPEGWTARSLEEVCEIGGGVGFPDKNQGRTDLPHPFIKVSDMNREGNERDIIAAANYVDEATLKTLGAKLFPAGSIVLPKVGAAALTNKRRRLTARTAVDNNIMVWVPVQVDPEFLFHWSQTVDVATLVQTGALPSLNKKIAGGISLLLPPPSEQRRIAEILSSVDEAIQATQAVIEQTRNVKQEVLKRLLTKGIGHTRFKQTEIGEIPEEWDAASLEDCGVSAIDGDRGKEYPKAADYSDAGYCLFLSAQNVTKRGFSFDTAQFISRERHEKLRKGVVERGDVVITTRGTVGNLAYYDESIPHDLMRINSGMAILRTDGHKVCPRYLYAALTSPVVEEQIEKLTFGSAQPQLTIKIIKGLIIPVPSREEQELVARRSAELAQAVREGERHLAALHSLKFALMSDLLTGGKRVSADLLMAAK